MPQIFRSSTAIFISTAAVILIMHAVSTVLSAQSGGGKAEPRRVEFESGRFSAELTGTLSNAQEAEYVFTAKAGQTVTITLSPKGLFDHRVFDPETDFETEFDSTAKVSFTLPADGDYYLFIRKKITRASKRARFSLILSIK
ncbi:MAG: PPC domain-containing protein [Acidobacteriota bacterium]